jgi:amidophosphoribosyltransferase
MWFVVARKRLPTPFALRTTKPNPTVIVLPVLSVALLNLGFQPENIKSLAPGRRSRSARASSPSNVSPARRAGALLLRVDLLRQRRQHAGRPQRLSVAHRAGRGTGPAGTGTRAARRDTIVVPVPDTSKAAADAMAYPGRFPSREGLIRNRYSGRTFIEGGQGRRKAETSTRRCAKCSQGQAGAAGRGFDRPLDHHEGAAAPHPRVRRRPEIHVRVACPPIIAPASTASTCRRSTSCSRRSFCGGELTEEVQAEMAAELGADSLRYLPVESIARAIGFRQRPACQACITRCRWVSGDRKRYCSSTAALSPGRPPQQARSISP